MLKIEQSEENRGNNKNIGLFSKLIFLVILIILLFYVFFYLLETHKMPFFIAFLIVLFLFLFLLGFILKNRKKSILSIFPQFRTKITREDQRKKYINQLERRPRPDILQFKYQKPLITKCPNCKMILTNFMKKCPKCNYEL
ncbi:MAG: hypothetical protein KGD63_14680 [Candidatus Lokiarchaeota archaeon]|nr:hypothetical protein [Candidatus Lokiarchaeota archaeon]